MIRALRSTADFAHSHTFALHRFSCREAGELYAAWRLASPPIRSRILDSPELFLKARRHAEPQPPARDELRRDLDLVRAIARRARRRWARAAFLMGHAERDVP